MVLQGSATFTVDGDQVAAPAGTLLVVPPGTRRGATAAEDGTTVMVIGGVPGAAGPRTPFEYWYEAEPHYRSGDYARAVAIEEQAFPNGHPDTVSLLDRQADLMRRTGREAEAEKLAERAGEVLRK